MAQLFTQIIHSTVQFADAARLEIMILVLTAGFQLLLYKLGRRSPFGRKWGSPKLVAAQSKFEKGSSRSGLPKVVKTSKTSEARTVTSYNIRIKEHLQKGDFKGAREIIEVMRAAGLKPNIVTFNELLDASVEANPPQDIWKIVAEMKACGLKPNHITCSILLKSVQAGRRGTDADRALAAIEEMEDDIDEVLLSSSLEACIRVGRNDLLQSLLKKYWSWSKRGTSYKKVVNSTKMSPCFQTGKL